MSKIAAIQRVNERELELDIAGTSASWHEQYHDKVVIYIGGLPTCVDERTILSIFEQYGTLTHVNLVRDAASGTSRGFAFAEYADARSAVLAIDNLNGFEYEGSMLRVDHVDEYNKSDGGGGMDTTPAKMTGTKGSDTGGSAALSVGLPGGAARGPLRAVRADAEVCREEAVMERLQALRKRRRGEPVVIGPVLETEEEKAEEDGGQRRAAKDMRRKQREAIREARSKRRTERRAERDEER